MNDTERDALLIRLDERTARADKALFGNGGGPQEGLMSRVSVVETRLDDRDRAAMKGGAAGSVLTAVIALVLTKLGVQI